MTTLRTILALYVLVWFNVIVPAHTRGVITLNPRGASADAAPRLDARPVGCCATSTAPSRDANGRPAPAKSKGVCAVCFVASTYSPAEAVSIDLCPSDWVETAAIRGIESIDLTDLPLTLYPTGPPAHGAVVAA